MNLPLFPLHTVLCPGVALPLHIFEDRYKVMVEECLADQNPFGVVLIREGREVGEGDLAVAEVGTLAEIREATRYPDGRFDLVTLGTQRFRLESVRLAPGRFLVGEMEPLDEVLGAADRARRLADHVSRRFIRYLELMQLDERADGAEADEADEGPVETHGTAFALEVEPSAADAASGPGGEAEPARARERAGRGGSPAGDPERPDSAVVPVLGHRPGGIAAAPVVAGDEDDRRAARRAGAAARARDLAAGAAAEELRAGPEAAVAASELATTGRAAAIFRFTAHRGTTRTAFPTYRSGR